MTIDQRRMPLFNRLQEFGKRRTLSFHVPGHKNGTIFPREAEHAFANILGMDLTELTGLDDLHAPTDVIGDAERLAAMYFQAAQTFFLVGGSTVGNLAMILAVCQPGDKLIVQRNSHKSIMNGLELAGAAPIFISPTYDDKKMRYIAPDEAGLEQAIQQHPDAKGVVLTYPDYFGTIYDLESITRLAHDYGMPVLVDEAHGVHFSLGKPFPRTALELGADVVVQSAHKMAPAMTMASYLHCQSDLVSKERLAHYLQMLQSSSPSYPLMASLDVARFYLATLTKEKLASILTSAEEVRKLFQTAKNWQVIDSNDPLKITLQAAAGLTGYEIADAFEQEGIYPELATDHQVLFIHGLACLEERKRLQLAIKQVDERLKKDTEKAAMPIAHLFSHTFQQLAYSYPEMQTLKVRRIPLPAAAGFVAAEAVIPYPPGIPILLKGERITSHHINVIQQMHMQGATFQHRALATGISIFEM